LRETDFGKKAQLETGVLVSSFTTAYQNNAMKQLKCQVGSAKIGMTRLASPQQYCVLSGKDFKTYINNPQIVEYCLCRQQFGNAGYLWCCAIILYLTLDKTGEQKMTNKSGGKRNLLKLKSP
jgi:hypothetical protein